VATLRNSRVVTVLRDGDGRALAEVADDTVTASASGPDGAAELQAWREVEVELVDGDEALLAPVGEWLVAAGARPSGSASKLARVLSSRLPAPPAAPNRRQTKRPTAGEAVLAAVRAQVDALQLADVGLRTDHPDAVHQVRVAARRLRSILASFRTVLDRAATEHLRTELAWLGGELGQARDDEVALGHLRGLVAEQAPELVLGPRRRAPAADGSAGRGGGSRARARDAGRRAVPQLARCPVRPAGRATARPRRRRARRAGLPGRGAEVGQAAAAAGRGRAARGRRGAGGGPPRRAQGLQAAPLHRRGGRRGARDVGEAAGADHQADPGGLGELQDTVVTREVCRRLGLAAAAAGENAFTFGLLHGLEEARAARAREAFAELEPALVPTLRAATRS
jgi:hypothetical protein